MTDTLMELLGYLAAGLTTASFVPQAVQTFRTRSTEGISLTMYSMFTAGVMLWLIYGLAIGSVPVIAANAITLVLAATILTLALQAARGPRPSQADQVADDETCDRVAARV